MVFNQHPGSHNRVNIRDTSTEPHNLYGDANLQRNSVNDEEMPPPLESRGQRRVARSEIKNNP